MPIDPKYLLSRLPPKLEGVYLTFLFGEHGERSTVSTFARDNAENFLFWWAVQCAKVNNPERDWRISLIRREFRDERDKDTGLPIKHLSGCAFWRHGPIPQTADDIRHGYEIEPDLIFVDWE